MNRTIDTVIGLDIGTTTSKALIRRLGRPASLIVQLPTRWRAEPGARTELEASAFLDLAVDLIGMAARAAEVGLGRPSRSVRSPSAG